MPYSPTRQPLKETNSTSASTPRSRLLKGTSAQAFGQVVLIVIRLAEVPLLLAFWGTQLYGEWLMLAAIPAYISIGDGGFAGAACRDMTMKSGAGDRSGTLAVFQSTWLLLLAVSLAAGLLAYGFSELVPLAKWLGFSVMTPYETRLVLLLLVAHVLVGFQGGLLNGGFWVSGRYPTGMVFSAITQLLEFFGFGLAIILGGGPVQAAAGYLGGRVLGTCLMWIGQRQTSSWLRYGFAHASLSELRRLTAPAFSSLAFTLGFCINIQGMRLVVGLALGPAAVAVFTPLRTLSRLAIQPRAIINQLIQPELATAFGTEDFPLFRRLFTRSCQLALWGCFLAALTVGAAAHWVFPAWTSGKVVMQWTTFILLLAGVLTNSVWYTALMVPYATNRHGRLSIFYSLIYGGFAIGLGYLGATIFGLAGVAFALLLAEATMATIVISESLQLANMKGDEWGLSVVKPPFDILRRAVLVFVERNDSHIKKVHY
jgi:O-antigen/teichoic acid export membrane protein